MRRHHHKPYKRSSSHSRRGHSVKHTFHKTRHFAIKHPLISAVMAIVISVILIRISFLSELFGQNISELRIWFLFFAALIGITGFVALIVWFRNHVSSLTTRHTVNWHNRRF